MKIFWLVFVLQFGRNSVCASFSLTHTCTALVWFLFGKTMLISTKKKIYLWCVLILLCHFIFYPSFLQNVEALVLALCGSLSFACGREKKRMSCYCVDYVPYYESADDRLKIVSVRETRGWITLGVDAHTQCDRCQYWQSNGDSVFMEAESDAWISDRCGYWEKHNFWTQSSMCIVERIRKMEERKKKNHWACCVQWLCLHLFLLVLNTCLFL